MAEEDVTEMVTCELSKVEVERDKAIEYKLKDSEDPLYVSAETVLSMTDVPALKEAILRGVALNETLFTEVVSIRKQAIAKRQGAQEGATEALKAIQAAAQELNVDLSDVIAKAFPQPEAEEKTEEPQENVH